MNKLEKAKKILKIIKKNGFQAFIVGGAVRDYLLHLPFNDIDIITNALPINLEKIFQINLKNIQYGSFILYFENEKFDITTYRIENKYQNHRYPQKIIFTTDIKKDIIRRDFTINSILMNDEENLIDYLNGISDIKNSLIKAIENPYKKFSEDALRIIRAFYLQSKLGFKIEKITENAIKKKSYLLKKISKEKILKEFLKIINKDHMYKTFLNIQKTNVIKYLKNFKKTIIFCIKNKIKKINKNIFLYLNFKFNKNIIHHYNFSKKEINLFQKLEIITRKKKLNLKFEIFQNNIETVILANQINFLFKKEKNNMSKINNINKNLIIKNENEIQLSTIDILKIIDKKPGKWIKKIKKKIIKLILNKKISNDKKSLLNYIKKLKRSDK